ncbi:helix-turn-helix domain-containing protein [Formosa sp. A9]|uniref:helix-turn-helix domain-containing protein n=1 Tax=Formosa sp. A9 TaxID=3442641 RepID=UPI003EBC6AFF
MQAIKLELPTEFKSDIDLIKSELKELKSKFSPKKSEELLTRNEVGDFFKINASSVHNWTKKGILTAYQCGGRVYYKRAEVEKAIVKLNK